MEGLQRKSVIVGQSTLFKNVFFFFCTFCLFIQIRNSKCKSIFFFFFRKKIIIHIPSSSELVLFVPLEIPAFLCDEKTDSISMESIPSPEAIFLLLFILLSVPFCNIYIYKIYTHTGLKKKLGFSLTSSNAHTKKKNPKKLHKCFASINSINDKVI